MGSSVSRLGTWVRTRLAPSPLALSARRCMPCAAFTRSWEHRCRHGEHLSAVHLRLRQSCATTLRTLLSIVATRSSPSARSWTMSASCSSTSLGLGQDLALDDAARHRRVPHPVLRTATRARRRRTSRAAVRSFCTFLLATGRSAHRSGRRRDLARAAQVRTAAACAALGGRAATAACRGHDHRPAVCVTTRCC